MIVFFNFLFSFLFISPALAQSGGETGGGLVVLLVIIAIIFLVVRNRKRVAASKRAAEQTEIARQLSRERAGIAIKTYKGTQEQATRLFQADAADMAALGYVPTTQSWAPNPVSWVRWGRVGFYGQAHGTLTVTYARQTASTSERRKVSVEDEEKTCPQCAERVKAAALVCRFCGYQFPSEKVLPPAGRA